MFKHSHNRAKAQSLVEFAVLLILVIAVFLGMNSYIKRGIQGRWKSAIDDFGDQYDPKQTNSNTFYSALTDANTLITTQPAQGGFFTTREDHSHSIESHNSYSQVIQEGDNFK